jgi:isocitrate lyase
METKTANVADAKRFADAIHEKFPDKMLAYNLSPSFNWDTTGMNDEEMKQFPIELGTAGFVFNFITYGGHQIDGLAAEEFAFGLQKDGMLALAKLQRRLRLLDSPYKTPQTLVGGMRFDGALAASSGRTAATVAMGKGSTQFQHLVQTEVPKKLLDHWLSLWLNKHKINDSLHTELRPLSTLSDLMELSVLNETNETIANVVFTNIQDRQERNILAIRNQGTDKLEYRQKRLMTLMQSFLVHRYKSQTVHYLSPTEDNHRAVEGMKKLGFFGDVKDEVGDIIVATVQKKFIQNLLVGDEQVIELIGKG